MNPNICVSKHRLRIGLLAGALATGAAHAHTGHGTEGFMVGLAHPLGPDHLLAMVAVGLWSALALPPMRAWIGPAVFMVSLIVGAVVGWLSSAPLWLEPAIAASVVMFGLMLMAALRAWPKKLGLVLTAVSALLHGIAHGAEAPATGAGSYALGFLITTLALHVVGVAGGIGLKRLQPPSTHRGALVLGALTGTAGLVLLARL